MRSAVPRLLSLGAAIIAALSLGAGPASAEIVACPSCLDDSPPKVLISNPATGSAAALPVSHVDHRALREALESGEPAPGFLPVDRRSGPIFITWLAADDAIRDVDLVRVGFDGELWVRPDTAPKDSSDKLRQGGGLWHAAADAAAARDVLERAGVLSTVSSTNAKTDSPNKSASMLTGTWWLLPGAAVGIALGLGARPLATELARRRDRGPRHQLIG